MYRMISLDIDGTLLNSQMKIPVNTKNTLIRLQEAGVIIILSSARPVSGMVDIARELKCDQYNGYLSALNGGEIRSAADLRVLRTRDLNQSELIEIYQYAKRYEARLYETLYNNTLIQQPFKSYKALYPLSQQLKLSEIGVMTYHNEHLYTSDFNPYVVIEFLLNQMALRKVDDFCASLNFNSPKVLISADPETVSVIYPEFKKTFQNRFEVATSDPFFIEITPKGVDKGESLSWIADHAQILLKDTIAFGDSHNDIPMLSMAGMGVAMANASEEVKYAADQVTASNDDDGIHQYLSQRTP